MTQKTTVIMILGLFILLVLTFFSYNYSKSAIEKNSQNTFPINFESLEMDTSLEGVLEKIGGGSFENEEVKISFEKEWMLNESSALQGGLIKDGSKVFLNAYSLGEDSATPWIFSVATSDSLDINSYRALIEQSEGAVKKERDDGVFIFDFETGTEVKTTTIQKIIKTESEGIIILSLTTTDSSLEKIESKFDSVLKGVEILNYKETVFLPSLNEDSEE